MKMRLNVIFYTFLIIFIATATISLLGVTRVVSIDKENLRWMLSATIIELAVAMIALFKSAPFFGEKPNVVSLMENSIRIIDEVFPDMEELLVGKAQAEKNRQYGIVMRKERGDLVAYQRLQIIHGSDIEKLPEEDKEAIERNKKAMYRFKDRWDETHSKLSEANTESEREEIEKKLAFLVTGMKKEFHSILDLLLRQGVVLQDHYQNVRNIVDDIASGDKKRPPAVVSVQ